MLKEKIFNALKTAIVDSKTGKTSISDKSINVYVDTISAQITEESQIAEAIKPHVTVLKEMQANINSVAASAVTEKETSLKAEHEAAIKALKDGKNPGEKGGDDIEARITAAVEAAVKPFKDDLDGYKSKEKLSQRNTLIASKAKELKIPEWRIKEGFIIADDTDEAAITASLTSVKQNLVTAGLEGKNEGAFSLSTPEAQSKDLAKTWAQDLPDA